jgi:hypothetical protein
VNNESGAQMINAQRIATRSSSSPSENILRDQFVDLFKQCPIPDNEVLSNLGLFLKRQNLSKILFMNDLYRKIIDVHGVVIEFGVRWGNNLALFASFRGIYEPFNHNRKIIGFDTFAGFPTVHEKDGASDIVAIGAYKVSASYEKYLEDILAYHEQESPIPHIKKHRLVKGDATVEVEKYFTEHPETVVAFAYFDFDLYEPTRKCLEAIKDRVTKGTVIGFDQLNDHDFPGETLALKEVFGLDKFKLRKSRYSSVQSYIVVE